MTPRRHRRDRDDPPSSLAPIPETTDVNPPTHSRLAENDVSAPTASSESSSPAPARPSSPQRRTKQKKKKRRPGVDGSSASSAVEEKKEPPTTAEAVDGRPIFVSTKETGSQWELTWPIWHMLPRDERKAIAVANGCKSIGEFEEFMTLSRAVGDSAAAVAEGEARDGKVPYDNGLLYKIENDPRNFGRATVAARSSDVRDDDLKPPAARPSETEDDGGSSSDTDEEIERKVEEAETAELHERMDAMSLAAHGNDEEASHLRTIERGGLPLLLPDDILHRAFSYLDVDMYGTLALVSPFWKSFTRTEVVYKALCIRCYMNQSKRKALHVSRFGHSYRAMLETRPRVRTGGGLYVLKYAEVKQIQRDMWTEIPVGAILETVYYRYLYFHEDGRVLYALTSSPPHEMIQRLLKMKITGEPDRAAVWGRFEVSKNDVKVWATQPWHDVRFEMKILPEGQPEGPRGKFCAMSFVRHQSSATGNFDEYASPDLVDYKVPNECFRFLRDWRL